jgi:EAL and modified HD-GYP domain-containing signal transduction protein
MQEDSILGQIVLGHSAMIDREHTVVATRLTVFPLRRDTEPDAQSLLQRLLTVWPAPPASDEIQLTLRAVGDDAVAPPPPPSLAPSKATPLSLNIASEPWLRAMLAISPPSHIMIEVPAFMAADPQHLPALKALHEAGTALVIKGRPVTELPRELLPCFRHSLIDVGEDRRIAGPAPKGVVRTITHIQLGIRTRADVDAAFERGAVAVLGWPLDDELQGSTVKSGGPDLQTVMTLMQRVDREEPVDRLETVLKNDPQLAFRLIRYLNSAAFGLSVEIASFRHALMMLGYKKLKRWLALLLASSSKDKAMKPVMQASVRRGLVMEELVRTSSDPEMRSEMFICGVFSLLDRLLGQPFAQLFKSVPVPERVQQALVQGTGPFLPYLNLTTALESGSRGDISDAADACLIGQAEINAALLRALAAARELD